MNLNRIKCLLLDMDGTVYLGNQPIGDMKNTLRRLRDRGIKLIFVTNNSSKTQDLYREKLVRLGLWDDRDSVYTSAMAACAFVKERFPARRVYPVATDAVKEYLISEGIHVVDEDAEVAILAYDTEFTYDKCVKLNRFLKKGAFYIATHPDVTCPAEDVFVPDVGSFLKLFEASAGRLPDAITGKPSPLMGETIMRETGFTKDEIAMAGDRMNTDIAFAFQCGFHSILVMSGETTEEMLAAAPRKPEFVLSDLNRIFD